MHAAVLSPVVAPYVPSGQALCVALQDPAGQKCPALHAPSHVAAVRTLAARPYLPALHVPLHVAAVAPAAPHVPQLHRFCVALGEAAAHQ